MTRHRSLRAKKQLGLPRWKPAVEGSFQDPPIVLRQSRRGTAFNLVGALAFGAAWIYFLGSKPWGTLHYLGLVAGALGLVSALLHAMLPGALILDPEGLIWRRYFRTTEFRWTDFRRFRSSSPDKDETVVEGETSNSFRQRLGWRRFFHLYGFGQTLSFGGGWEVPNERAAEVLEEALHRWHPGGPAHWEKLKTGSLFAQDRD